MLKNIVIAGVGGQGTILSSKILITAAEKLGYFIRTSETIGMAQRGGSVCSHIRIGTEDVSPVIPSNHADILIGFELAEATRQIPKLKKDSLCIVNIDQIVPTNVSLKKGVYLGDEYLATLKKFVPNGVYVSATELALKAGNARTLNVVLLGAALGAGVLPFSKEEIIIAIKECVKPKLIDMNLYALELGIESTSK
ncbi:MAG: indolepyruvate oxidoreductase subunit beta [Synergistaceae bacterium]